MFGEKVQAVPQLNNEEVQWQQREKDFKQDLLADRPYLCKTVNAPRIAERVRQ